MQSTALPTGAPGEYRVSPEPPATPYGDLVAALRVVARRHLCGDVPTAEVRSGLQAVSRMARARGLSAAQVITAAKTAWSGLPEVRTHCDPSGHGERLERLVSLCVEAYYAG